MMPFLPAFGAEKRKIPQDGIRQKPGARLGPAKRAEDPALVVHSAPPFSMEKRCTYGKKVAHGRPVWQGIRPRAGARGHIRPAV